MGKFAKAIVLAALGIAAFTPASVSAQALTPMRLKVKSYSDSFAIKVNPTNPYKHRIRMNVKVYDQKFRLIKARVTPNTMMLGAGSSRQVTVLVPFEGKSLKKIRICAESIPFPNQKTLIRAQVCGRYMAQRVQ